MLTTHTSSYEAAEDNEISFVVGDRITEIEPASEDWWQGKDKHGNVGLFPGEFFFFFSLAERIVDADSFKPIMLKLRRKIEEYVSPLNEEG